MLFQGPEFVHRILLRQLPRVTEVRPSGDIEMTRHLTTDELQSGLPGIQSSPSDDGKLMAIVVRPDNGQRASKTECGLDPDTGVAGDNWASRESPNTEAQLTLMNWRAAELVAADSDHWMLAGDQLYVDFDLSNDNLPPGTHVQIGTAVLRISLLPHNGCKKFAERFGKDAMRFVNSPIGKQLHLRGVNASIVEAGTVRVGDTVSRK